jgi:cytochrome c oxidase subunit 3
MSGPYGMALLNTLLLLNSGASLTWSHRATLVGGKKHSLISLHYITLFAVLFMDIQLYEYKIVTFSIADGIYGSCFYLFYRVSRISCFCRDCSGNCRPNSYGV